MSNDLHSNKDAARRRSSSACSPVEVKAGAIVHDFLSSQNKTEERRKAEKREREQKIDNSLANAFPDLEENAKDQRPDQLP